MKRSLTFLLLLLATAALAAAGDTIQPGDVVVERPTLLCLGFRWKIEGDDNRNATVDVAYRAQGKGEWKTALPLLRIKGEVIAQEDDKLRWTAPNLFAGSILDLAPATEYEVKLTMKDPDGGGAEKVLKVKTRSEPVAFDGGHKLHVYPPEFAGAKQAPAFTGLAAAYAQAEPGDLVLVHVGTYSVPKAEKKERTDYVLDKVATAERPLVIRAAGDGEVVFDGGGALKLIDCQAAQHHFFEGLTFRDAEHLIYAGRQQGMQGLVVRGCKFERSNYPIFALHGSCRDFYIADSEFVGNYPEWHPQSTRANDSHAVWMQGQGHVVCRNRFSGYWDGVDIYGRVPEADPEHWNCAIDIYENEFSAMGDDAVELDYGMHNVRAFRNYIWNVFDGISMQPINGGPAYVWRNIVFNCTRNPIKPEQFPAGLYIVNNTFVCWGSAGQLSRMWQNARIYNNLFIGSGGAARVLVSGTPTPETTMLDYDGWRWFEGKERGPIYWRFAVPSPGPGPNSKRLNLEWTYASFEEFVKSTPYEHHGVLLDFDIFAKVEIPSGTNTPLPVLDLRLRPGSKAVDAGLPFPNLTDGFAGTAPDLGAIELGGVQWAYGPRKGTGK